MRNGCLMGKPYQLGIIPCTRTKNKNGKTARTLYHGGPFSQRMQHAMARCDRILILSAKYGLIPPEHPVEWYEAFLPTLSTEARAALAQEVQLQLLFINLPPPGRVLSYLPESYNDFLRGLVEPCVAPGFTESWDYHRPFSHMYMNVYKRMAEEIIRDKTIPPSFRIFLE